MQKRKEVVFRSDLKISARLFDKNSGEITFFGSFKDGDRLLTDLPFLRLLVEQFDEHSGIDVIDEYCVLIPYLKHVQAFRGFFQHHVVPFALRDPLISANVFLKCGLYDYARELATFPQAKALVSQAKSAVNRLDPSKPASSQTARDILKVLDVAPCTDLEFFF